MESVSPNQKSWNETSYSNIRTKTNSDLCYTLGNLFGRYLLGGLHQGGRAL